MECTKPSIWSKHQSWRFVTAYSIPLSLLSLLSFFLIETSQPCLYINSISYLIKMWSIESCIPLIQLKKNLNFKPKVMTK